MKKRQIGRLLSVVLSAALAFTSVVPSYAMEGAVDGEEAVESEESAEEAAEGEEILEEVLEDDLAEGVTEDEEEVLVESDYDTSGESELLGEIVEDNLPSPETLTRAFGWATLLDKDGKEVEIEEPFITYDVTGEKSATLYYVCKGLKKFYSEEDLNAPHYWYGGAVNVKILEAEGFSVKMAIGYADQHEDGSFEDNEYFDVNTKEKPIQFTSYVDMAPVDDYYVSIRYMDGEQIVRTYTFYQDFSGVTLSGNLPGLQKDLIAAPLEDRSGALKPEELYTSYSIGEPEADTENNMAVVPVFANNLRQHTAGNGSLGYWVGVGIAREDLSAYGVNTKYIQSYTAIENLKADDERWTDHLDDVYTVGEGDDKVTYETVYFNCASKDLIDNTGYVYVMYTDGSESAIDTYAIDMNGIARDDHLPSPEDVEKIVTAPLVDKNIPSIETVIKDYDVTVTPIVSDEEAPFFDHGYKLSITGKELKQHRAGNGAEGYWVGIGIPQFADVTTTADAGWILSGDYYDVAEVRDDVYVDEDKKAYDTFYFNAKSANWVTPHTGYLAVKYAYEGAEVTYQFVIDMSGVELDDGLPEAATNVIAATLHDTRNEGTEEEKKEAIADKDIASEYSVSEGVILEDNSSIEVAVKAKDLKAHKAGDGAGMGHWVGFGIPRTTLETVTKTEFKQSYTELDPDSIVDWKESLDSTMTEGEVTYDTVYFDAAKADLDARKGYVYVKYTAPRGDSVIYTYVFDMGDVEITGLPTVAEATAVVAPTLEDHPNEGEEKITDLYTEGTYKATTTGGSNEKYNITLSAKDLKAHRNGQHNGGYWAGVGFYWPQKTDKDSKVSIQYSKNNYEPVTKDSEFYDVPLDEVAYEEDGKSYLALYYDLLSCAGDDEGNRCVYAGIRYSDGTATETFYYTINVTDVTFYDDAPDVQEFAKIATAPLHDTRTEAEGQISDEELNKGYSAELEEITTDEDGLPMIRVNVHASSLLKHKAGDGAGMGYWAGIGIPVVDMGPNYEVSYAQSYDDEDPEFKDKLDSELVDAEGKVTHKTAYFNVASDDFDQFIPLPDRVHKLGKYGHIYVQYNSKIVESQSYTYHYVIDFSEVRALMGDQADDVIAANLHDTAAKPVAADDKLAKDYSASAYFDPGPVMSNGSFYVPVDITAKDLMQHTAGNGAIGYWVGVGIPEALRADVTDGREVVYAYSKTNLDEEELPGQDYYKYDEFFDSFQEKNGEKYDTIYFDAEKLAGTNEKRYVIAQIIEMDLISYVIYEIGFKDIELQQKEYFVTVTENNDFGVLINKQDEGTFTITAQVKASQEGEPLKNVPVVWASSDKDMATVKATSGYTDGSGKAYATVTVNKSDKVGVFYISATAGSSTASLEYVVYAYDPDAAAEASMTLPQDGSYVFTPAYVLPPKSDYSIRWESSDESIVTVDSDGVVYAVANGTADIYQGIVNADGKYVDKFGRARESGLLKTDKGFYTVVVNTDIEKAEIVQEKDVYAKDQEYEKALKLDIYPETFDWGDVAEINWSSSNPNVAEVARDNDPDTPEYATVTTKNVAGSSNIRAEIFTKYGKSYVCSYLLQVLPAVDKVTIKQLGSDEALDYLTVKVGKNIKLFAFVDATDSDADTSVTWSVTPNAGISVSSTGLITANAVTPEEEDVFVYATTPDGTVGKVEVASYDNIEQVMLTVKELRLKVGQIYDLEAIPYPGNGTDYLFDIQCEDESIVKTYTQIGFSTRVRLAAQKEGNTTVTFTDKVSGISATCNITVSNDEGSDIPVKEIIPTEKDIKLYEGEEAQLEYTVSPENCTNYVYEWAFRDGQPGFKIELLPNGIVRTFKNTVDEVTTVPVTITAKKVVISDNGDWSYEPTDISATYNISVLPIPHVTDIAITPSDVTLAAPVEDCSDSDGVQLSAMYYPTAADAVIEWESDDPLVATVDETGFVEAVSPGVAFITAKAFEYDTETEDYTKWVWEKSVNVTVLSTVDGEDLDTGRYIRNGLWIGAVDEYTYSGTAFKPEPNVYYGSVLLTKDVDYTLSYKNNTNAARTKNNPTVTAKFKGNYSGTVTQEFVINPADISDLVTVNNISALAKVNSKRASGFAEQLLKPVLTFNGKTLKQGKDYELLYLEDSEEAYEIPGTWEITIVGEGNYQGETFASEILINPSVARNISSAKIEGLEKSYYYTGEPIEPETLALSYNGTGLVLHEDYEVTFSNNVNLGTATVTVTGLDRGENGPFYGSKKATFKIVPYVTDLGTLGKDDLDITIEGMASTEAALVYVKGGAKPTHVTVSVKNGDDGFIDLTGADFTWNSKVPSNKVGKGIGKVTIKGKGKFYKGSISIPYDVLPQRIDNMVIEADDFVYSPKARAFEKNKIAVYDLNGKQLGKGDYEITDFISDRDVPFVGDEVTVYIKGKAGSCYDVDGTAAAVSFRIIDKAKKINAATFAFMVDGEEIAANKFYIKYEGTPVYISKDNIVLKVKKKVGRATTVVTLDPSEYEIIDIRNNNKVGTATVIVKGTGEYGGLKTLKFKIKK